MRHTIFILLSMVICFSSCVSRKKLKTSEAVNKDLMQKYADLEKKLGDCNTKNNGLSSKESGYLSEIDALKKQNDFLKQNNTQAINQLKDLSVISGAQAQSIVKSLENIGAKDAYIQTLQSSLKRKDSLNMALVMNLKGAIGDLNDKDINIKVEKGVIYIDISDKLLFNSGSYTITPEANLVLGKVAKVLLHQPDIEFMVEGHTDNVPFSRGPLIDNWDLSTKRATSVIRILQKAYGIPAAHMVAAGRSEYIPVADNNSTEGRMANRRTRIIILPQLDQFFRLLEHK